MDLHCHLDLYQNPEKIIAEIVRRKIVVFSVTTTPSAFLKTKLMSDHAASIYTGIGLHPQIVSDRFHELDQISQYIGRADFVGEIGLDGGPEYKQSWSRQVEVFTQSIAASERVGGKVLSIHSRRATKHVLQILRDQSSASTPILHWFSGTHREMQEAIEAGCWFSVGPAMLIGNKGKALLKDMPMDRVLLETDGPFTRKSDSPYLPWDAIDICPQIIAEVWNKSQSLVVGRLANNLRTILERIRSQ
ncbi:Qat anti-phage system TatD family nuclease QatD [Hyphococcus sp.]|uniref:Qat anti-phage system TatD family nuclease QatD n=1 Tax=Hyphococcus sp. TaxID=2038636 RepID=UPI0035C672E6